MSDSGPHHTPGVSVSGVVFALASLLCWSVTPLFVKKLTGTFDLWESNGWRYGAAALVWLPLLVANLLRGRLPKGVWKRALIPAVCSAGAQVAFVGSFYQIQPGLVTFGMRLQIVATAVGAWFLFPGERAIIRRPSFLLGGAAVALGTIGVGLLADAPAPGDGNLALGLGLAMLAGVGYAGYAVAVRKCMAGVSARMSFAVISLYVGGAMLLLMVLFGEDPVPSLVAMDAGTWVLFVLSVLFGLAVGHVIYFTAMEKLGVAPATGVVQLQPFTVAAGSYFIFKEVFSAGQMVCGVVAVGGAGVMLWTQHSVAKRKKIGALRAFDELPVDPPVAMEEAERCAAPERES